MYGGSFVKHFLFILRNEGKLLSVVNRQHVTDASHYIAFVGINTNTTDHPLMSAESVICCSPITAFVIGAQGMTGGRWHPVKHRKRGWTQRK